MKLVCLSLRQPLLFFSSAFAPFGFTLSSMEAVELRQKLREKVPFSEYNTYLCVFILTFLVFVLGSS